MRIETQILQRLFRTSDKSSQRSESLRERPVDERNSVFYAEFLSRAATMFATGQRGVSFVNKNAGAVRFRHVNQFLQIAEVAVHRINAFHYDELTPAFLTAECCIEGAWSSVLEFLRAASGKHRSV